MTAAISGPTRVVDTSQLESAFAFGFDAAMLAASAILIATLRLPKPELSGATLLDRDEGRHSLALGEPETAPVGADLGGLQLFLANDLVGAGALRAGRAWPVFGWLRRAAVGHGGWRIGRQHGGPSYHPPHRDQPGSADFDDRVYRVNRAFGVYPEPLDCRIGPDGRRSLAASIRPIGLSGRALNPWEHWRAVLWWLWRHRSVRGRCIFRLRPPRSAQQPC